MIATVLLGLAIGVLWHFLRREMSFVANATVKHDDIEDETGFGRVYLDWEDIREAGW